MQGLLNRESVQASSDPSPGHACLESRALYQSGGSDGSRTVRVKRLLLWISVIFVGLGIVLAVGVAGPRLLISDGVAQFAGEERAIAEEALNMAPIWCFDNPIEWALIQKVQVVEMKFEPERCKTPLWSGRPPGHGFRVMIRAYTFFGIPTGTIVVCGDEAVCHRWLLD